METSAEPLAYDNELAVTLSDPVVKALTQLEQRNSDRFLGTVPSLVNLLRSKGSSDSTDAKALENTFATYHEEVLKQALSQLIWQIELTGEIPRSRLLPAVKAALQACEKYARGIADHRWSVEVEAPLKQAPVGIEKWSTQAIADLKERIDVRRSASDLWLDKQLYDNVGNLLLQQSLNRASLISAQASFDSARATERSADYAKSMGKLTFWMVILTLFVAVGTSAAAIGALWPIFNPAHDGTPLCTPSPASSPPPR
jgi:hypothetical protein